MLILTGQRVSWLHAVRARMAGAHRCLPKPFHPGQVHRLLLAAASRTPGVAREPAPFVLQAALSDFYVDYRLRVRVDDPLRRFAVLSELHAQIQDAFNAAGVQIMSPNYEADPDRPKLVPREHWDGLPVPEAAPAPDLPSRLD